MGVTESMNGNHGNVGAFAVPFQNVIDRGVVDLVLLDKDRLIVRQAAKKLGELDNDLPVDLNLPYGRLILGWEEAAFSLIVPGFIDGERLM